MPKILIIEVKKATKNFKNTKFKKIITDFLHHEFLKSSQTFC